jgi:formate hydrogenlyase subunit 4
VIVDPVALIVTLASTILIAPLLQGLIKRVKAFWQGRVGPPWFQAYYDLTKLARKGSVTPEPASWWFDLAPSIVLSATLVAVALIPIAGDRSPLGVGDVILVAGCLALARFALALAALDTGSNFGGMGASREMAIAALVEPALLVTIFGLAIPAGSTDLGQLAAAATPLDSFGPSTVLALAALLIVAIAETGRIPVDNPDTHLELTMVHEGMLLEYSGRPLGLLVLAALIKQVVVLSLIAALVGPWGMLLPLPLALLVWLAKLAVLGVFLACAETAFAKLRILRLPELLASGFALGGLSLVARAVWGG